MDQQMMAYGGMMLLLGSVLFFGVCGVAFVVAAARRSHRAVRWIVGIVGVYAVGYLVALFGVSMSSREHVLSVGQEKHFCAIDCHLAYSVMGQRSAATVGDDVKSARATRGRFEVVEVKVRFDETSISPRRGNAWLTPDPKRFALFDDRGRRYKLSQAAIDAVAHTPAGATSWLKPLRPGEWFMKEIAFDVPPDARGFRLLIEEPDPVYMAFIGHENSLGHKKTYLAVGA